MDKLTKEQWDAEGTRLFGLDKMTWRFQCPACKHVMGVRDYQDARAPSGVVGYSCIGRYHPDGPRFRDLGQTDGLQGVGCDYAGGGLFGLNPQPVEFDDGAVRKVFAFAPEVR
jgi:hypothetical protein